MYLTTEARSSNLAPVKLVRGRSNRRRRMNSPREIQSVTSAEEFMLVHGHERLQLAIRKRSGATLSERELARLEMLEARLDRLLPAPVRQSTEVNRAVREAERLIREHG